MNAKGRRAIKVKRLKEQPRKPQGWRKTVFEEIGCTDVASLPLIDCLRECPSIGACCRRLALWSSGQAWPNTEDPVEAQKQIDTWGETGLPFEIIERADEYGGLTGEPTGFKVWLVGCKMVMSDGMCGIYEHRPKLCRDFRPGADPLCVKHPLHHQNWYGATEVVAW